jgi:DNA invertase Pin-like site-specific DNA recombinase
MSSKSKPLRAGGYCRTSGEGQRDNTSIPRQKEAIEVTCKANGWELARHYVDECKSGAKTEGREEFKQMMTDAANGQLDIVVPFDATRFARDGVDIVSTAKFLKTTYGIPTVDSKGQFDNRDHRNSLRNFVQAGVSEHERLTIMERMIGGRVQKAKAGVQWSGHCPIGRTFTPALLPNGKKSKTDGTWSVNDRGRALAALLQRYVEGESLYTLVKEYGFTDPENVRRIVQEGQLAAKPYIATFNAADIGMVNLEIPVPQVPPIISKDLERRVKERLLHNRTWNKQHLRKYLLTGFVHCGHCGKSLTGATHTGHAYYGHRWGPKCAFRSLRADIVEGPVLDYVYTWFIDQPAFDRAVTLALPSGKDRKEKEEDAQRIEGSLKECNKQIANLVNAIAAGADPALLIGKQEELKAERQALSKRHQSLAAELEALPDPQAVKEQAKVIWQRLTVEHIGKDWRQQSWDNLRRFLQYLLSDSPKKNGLGIWVTKDQGHWGCALRARLEVSTVEAIVLDPDESLNLPRLTGWPTG